MGGSDYDEDNPNHVFVPQEPTDSIEKAKVILKAFAERIQKHPVVGVKQQVRMTLQFTDTVAKVVISGPIPYGQDAANLPTDSIHGFSGTLFSRDTLVAPLTFKRLVGLENRTPTGRPGQLEDTTGLGGHSTMVKRSPTSGSLTTGGGQKGRLVFNFIIENEGQIQFISPGESVLSLIHI